MLHDVIIAGAGPVGLFLACELRLAHASVLVLERDLNPSSPWKVLPLGRRSLNTSSLEAFHRRGILDQFVEKTTSAWAAKPGFRHGGFFAGITLNASRLDLGRWKYRLDGPALFPAGATIERIESVLAERAEKLGVEILRGKGVDQVTAGTDSVTVTTAEKESFTGKWLVGCDGGRSTVRKASGFEFVGTEPTFTGYVAECDFDRPEKLKPGFHVTDKGMYIIAPGALYLLDFDGGAYDRSREPEPAHLQEMFARISGIKDVQLTSVRLARSFTDRSNQASTYRKGRVFLAGDAAHIHSPVGSQGLNLGLGDALNLGWKLGAAVRSGGSENDTLLDTYEAERHAVGAEVLELTRGQVDLLKPGNQRVHAIVKDLLDSTEGTTKVIGQAWGLSRRYDLGSKHPLVGCSAPDFKLGDGSRLGPKLEKGRGLLVDFGDDEALRGLVGEFEGVDYLGTEVEDALGLRALLVRPDGVVAWVAEGEEVDLGEARDAMGKWFRF